MPISLFGGISESMLPNYNVDTVHNYFSSFFLQFPFIYPLQGALPENILTYLPESFFFFSTSH